MYYFEIKYPYQYGNDDLYTVLLNNKYFLEVNQDKSITFNVSHPHYDQIHKVKYFTKCVFAIQLTIS